MEAKSHAPSFTVSLRGYDREEVDEYLDSLAEALARVEEAEQQSRRLQAHVARCNARIKELEDRIRADTPKSGAALGERIGMLLREAEDAAAEILARADADAARLTAAAEQRAAESDERVRHSTALAEEQARRIESVARGEAAEIVSEAEARAVARTRQIEQWAEQVVSHTRAEEARMVAEHRRAKAAKDAELQGLEEQRISAVAALTELRETLGRAVGLISESPAPMPEQPDGAHVLEGDEGDAEMMLDGTVAAEAADLAADPAIEPSGAEPTGDEPNGAEPAETTIQALATEGAAHATSAPADEDVEEADRTGELAPVAADQPAEAATVRFNAADLSTQPRPVSLYDDEAVKDDYGSGSGGGLGMDEAQFEAKLDRWVSGGR